MNSQKKKSLLFGLLCVICWAFIPVVSKLGQFNLDNYQFLFWSNLFSCFVLFIYTIASGKLKNFLSYTKSQVFVSFFLGLLGTCVYYLLLYYAYAHAKGLEVLVIQYTWPIFVTIFLSIKLFIMFSFDFLPKTGITLEQAIFVFSSLVFLQIHQLSCVGSF